MHDGPEQNFVHARARRDHDLALDQVDVGDHLRDRVLDLNAGIHLNEVQAPVLIHQKFDRARVGVADRSQRSAQHLPDLAAQLGRDLRRRRLFEQLLMAALDGAFALAQADHVAVLVGQYLKFDVAGMVDVLLHVEVAVAECCGGLGLGRFEESRQFLFAAHDAHAASAAARRSLHDHRETNLPRPFHGFAFGRNDAVRPGENGHASLLHGGAGFFLLAHQAGDFRPRTDELDAAGLAHFGKIRVLGQQSIAGMHRLDVGNFSSADHGGNVQIAQG